MEISGRGTLDFDHQSNTRSARQLKLDLSRVDYFNLYGLAAISCCLVEAARSGHRVAFYSPQGMSACNFISRLGFDDFFRDQTGSEIHLEMTSHQGPSDVLVPFQSINDSKDLLPLQEVLDKRLAKVAGPQTRAALNEALWELGANVTEHSLSAGVIGAVVQRPNRKGEHIDFAIGDAGIGIMESFLRGAGRHRPSSDHEAIERATEYLVSSVDDPGRGQGLHYVIDQALALNGTVVIRSGSAKRTMSRMTGSKVDFRAKPRLESVPPIAGTLVFVSIPCR